ncbi:hypothetical protein Pelo_13734 [Pelomyxa schiedti]|nr:hypothetical protein Pelo_13734 [Pelomyxa schiedti]
MSRLRLPSVLTSRSGADPDPQPQPRGQCHHQRQPLAWPHHPNHNPGKEAEGEAVGEARNRHDGSSSGGRGAQGEHGMGRDRYRGRLGSRSESQSRCRCFGAAPEYHKYQPKQIFIDALRNNQIPLFRAILGIPNRVEPNLVREELQQYGTAIKLDKWWLKLNSLDDEPKGRLSLKMRDSTGNIKGLKPFRVAPLGLYTRGPIITYPPPLAPPQPQPPQQHLAQQQPQPQSHPHQLEQQQQQVQQQHPQPQQQFQQQGPEPHFADVMVVVDKGKSTATTTCAVGSQES